MEINTQVPGRLLTRISHRLGNVRHVLQLALPSAGEQLLSMMVGIVDTFLVGHLGAASLTGVGLANQWVMVAMVLFSAVGTGGTALIARMIGAKQGTEANRVVLQALLVAAVFGLLATAPLYIWAEPAVRLMGAQGDALSLGTTYLRIASLAFLFSAIMFVGNACLRGAGDTRTPLYVMAVVNLMNIVVAWSLINGAFGLPRLGVAGSAIGATVGRLTGGLLVVLVLVMGKGRLSLDLHDFRADADLIRRILRVGLPTGMEQLIFRMGMMSYARVVASLGTAAYAAHQVAINGESISFMPGFGFAVAATTLVGQGLGAGDKDRAERDGYTAFYIAATVMTLMGVVFFIFAPQIFGLFTDDPEVIALGVTPLRLIALAQPFLAATMVFAGALRGAGETRAPMLVNGGSIWVVRVPLSLLFTQVLGWGLTGAWVAMAVDLTVRGTLMFSRFRSGRWKNVEV
jgi:multidrug resistance protein, MATE family